MERFRVAATGISINYMPEYVADKMGFFDEVGLDYSTYAPSPWTQVLTDIDEFQAEAVVGGIWLPMMYMDRIKNYRSFAKIASRCPLFIVGRVPSDGKVNWKDLENKRVLVSGGDGASHYLSVRGVAKEGGADVDKIRFIHDFSTSMLFDLFKGGFGDYVVLQPDLAKQVISDKQGYLFCDLTTHGGVIPWSVYYATEEVLNKEDLAGKFTLALQKATTWLLENGGEACSEIIKNKWPNLKVEDGIDTINLFISQGMWTDTVEITEEELYRWQEFLIDGDVIDGFMEHEKLVDLKPFSYCENYLNKGE